MNILVDRHHAGLLQSLHYLLEGRLKMNMYVPVGPEWWNEQYWQFGETAWHDDRLAQQYLYNPESHGWRRHSYSAGDYVAFDVEFPDTPIWGVTLARAREMKWDFVMPTVQENQIGFHRFAQEVGARYLYQVGNNGQQINWSLDPLVLLSATTSIAVPDSTKVVRYSQEFSMGGLFAARAGGDPLRIANFVNCLNSMPEQWSRFQEIEKLLPEFQFDVHGHDGRDGLVQPTRAIADAMAACGFGWQDKPQGDGFGHVIHYWASIGRPLIGTRAYYAGKLAEYLWEDGVTAICLDGKDSTQVASEIREVANDPERWLGMCRAIRERLVESVDFGAEATKVAALLGL